MSMQTVAPRVVNNSYVTLQLNTKVGPFLPGSTLVTSVSYASNLVNNAPECVSLSRPIRRGAYVVVNQSYGCYPYEYTEFSHNNQFS